MTAAEQTVANVQRHMHRAREDFLIRSAATKLVRSQARQPCRTMRFGWCRTQQSLGESDYCLPCRCRWLLARCRKEARK